jgi:hypothetical protein
MARQGGSVVLFGGTDPEGNLLDDTWTWDGTTWTQQRVTGPSARYGAAMAAQGSLAMLFGGQDPAWFGDTWAWTGAGWLLQQATGPSARTGSSAATVAATQTVALFGGEGAPNGLLSLGDTWVWNGVRWSMAATAGPSARVFATAATAAGEVVLFGGYDEQFNPLGDTWTWDGTSSTQHDTTGPMTAPSARASAAMGSVGDTAVLFGGLGGANAVLDDTWIWDGASWTLANVQNGPPARFAAAMSGF